MLGTAVGLALGPASDHLSCCPSTNFIQEEAQQHMAWLLKEPNLHHINTCIFSYQPRTSKPSSSTKTSCNGKQYAMYCKRNTQALVQPGRIARTESQKLALDSKGSPVSGLPSKLLQNFTLMTDHRKSTGSLYLASPIGFPFSITAGAHIETHTGFQ